MTFPAISRRQALGLASALALGAVAPARAQGQPIKVGILHSLTGPLAISETTLKDVLLMLIGERNAAGGVMGRPLTPVVLDPGSDPRRFAERAEQLIADHGVEVIFGGWTSAARKAMLPVLGRRDALLFYPAQYEGRESSRNVFYTGAAPNQQALPALAWMAEQRGVERWFLIGSDTAFPRSVNLLLRRYLRFRGVPETDIVLVYLPLDHRDWREQVNLIKTFGRNGRPAGVVSTINGASNLPFYRELRQQGVDAADIPVMAMSVSEEEISGVDVAALEGHLSAWGYFHTLDTPANRDFIARWRAFTNNPLRVVNDAMEAHRIGFSLWADAVEAAGSTATPAIRRTIIGLKTPTLSGGEAEMLANHHITRPAMVGAIRPDGLFDVVARSAQPIPGDPWVRDMAAIRTPGAPS